MMMGKVEDGDEEEERQRKWSWIVPLPCRWLGCWFDGESRMSGVDDGDDDDESRFLEPGLKNRFS